MDTVNRKKMLVFSFVTSASLSTFIYFVIKGEYGEVKALIESGIFFICFFVSGILFSWIFLNKYSQNFLESLKNKTNVQQEILINNDLETCMRKCVESVKILQLYDMHVSANEITFKTYAGLKSFGERVTIVVREEVGQCNVAISSKSLIARTLIDYGKNKKNVDLIVKKLMDLH